jgi:hypothetical protein
VFEVGSAKLLDAPKKTEGSVVRVQGIADEIKGVTYLPFSLSSLSPMILESFLNSRLDLALSESTMRFWRCHSRQLKFSRR